MFKLTSTSMSKGWSISWFFRFSRSARIFDLSCSLLIPVKSTNLMWDLDRLLRYAIKLNVVRVEVSLVTWCDEVLRKFLCVPVVGGQNFLNKEVVTHSLRVKDDASVPTSCSLMIKIWTVRATWQNVICWNSLSDRSNHSDMKIITGKVYNREFWASLKSLTWILN